MRSLTPSSSGNMCTLWKSWVAPEPSQFYPYVTFLITGVCFLVYFLGWNTAFVWDEGFSKSWHLATSLFSHGSIQHLMGNMLLLLLVGPACEKHLGRLKYLALYLLSGAGAALFFGSFATETGILGASGALSGLLAVYPFLRRNLVGFLFGVILVGFSFLGDFTSFLQQVLGVSGSHTAHLAHVAGGVVGVLALAFFRRNPR